MLCTLPLMYRSDVRSTGSMTAVCCYLFCAGYRHSSLHRNQQISRGFQAAHLGEDHGLAALAVHSQNIRQHRAARLVSHLRHGTVQRTGGIVHAVQDWHGHAKEWHRGWLALCEAGEQRLDP